MTCSWTLTALEGSTVELAIRGHMDGDEAQKAIETFQEFAQDHEPFSLVVRLDGVTGYESTVPGWWADAVLESRDHLKELVLVGLHSLILRTTARIAAKSAGIAIRCEE